MSSEKKFMEKLGDDIQEARNIKPTSLKVYLFNIEKLHDKIYSNRDILNLNFLQKRDKVMKAIEGMKLSSRKTYLASIVVALSSQGEKYEKEVKFYRDEMEDLAKKYTEEQEQQKMSEKEEKNWTSLSSLRKVMRNYRNELKERKVFEKDSGDLNNKEFDLMQKWVVSGLYVLDDQAPLRNDYIMDVITNPQYSKLTDSEKAEKNYLVVKSRNNKFFSLGEYKTAGKYGTKEIEVGRRLNSMLNIWLKYNTTGHLLLNSKKEPMTANGLTKYLNKTFEPSGKSNISSSLIRHIYITEKIGGPSLKEKQEIAEKMGHSVSQQELYKKH
ncbi:MAG: hypothetical protein H8E55_15535 [Pelagibacterales bacterium]|nr:hypothetical protein [Pelagibacterales bacterium]